jgi:hypothetical protein
LYSQNKLTAGTVSGRQTTREEKNMDGDIAAALRQIRLALRCLLGPRLRLAPLREPTANAAGVTVNAGGDTRAAQSAAWNTTTDEKRSIAAAAAKNSHPAPQPRYEAKASRG